MCLACYGKADELNLVIGVSNATNFSDNGIVLSNVLLINTNDRVCEDLLNIMQIDADAKS